MFMIPSFRVGGGVDYNIPDESFDFLFRFDMPIRRGGVFGRGSMLSFRWLPGRNNTINLGISVPTWGPNLGSTRPKRDYVKLDPVKLDPRQPQRLEMAVVDDTVAKFLEDIQERAHWIARLSQPFAEQSGADPRKAVQADIDSILVQWKKTDDRFPSGHTLNEEIRVYHESLDRAFSLSTTTRELGPGETTELGRQVCAKARRILVDEVLLPYNYYLGQRKKKDTLTGNIAVGQTKFARWLLSGGHDLSEEEARLSFLVFQTICDVAEEIRGRLRKRWEDSRLVWMPLELGLRPEDHDTQVEMDDIVSRASRKNFSRGNRIWYVLNEDFQWELARSLQVAEDYHVLWIHDIRGVNGQKKPDYIAYLQVGTYLESMIKRVREYDEVGKIPLYMIFLDQHYFEINKSRTWLRLLREPLTHTISLPSGYEEWETTLRDLQEQLREAVEVSMLLRLERSQYGNKWLENRLRVHVNITNPADPSFVSNHVAGILPIPDNMMRDHRKIAFYDITEKDPYKGQAMFTGMGVGEHYVGANWEDRALMIQGPEALAVKDAARALLLNQGFTADEIPYPLRSEPLARDYEQKIQAQVDSYQEWLNRQANVIQIHNETGFNDKPINAAKAVLYSLMPRGSVLNIPDSLWQSYIYASLLAGSALRGCRVQVIAPTLKSAPSSAAPTMARAHGLMGRIMAFNDGVRKQIASEGGLLAVGLYNPQQGVGDIAGRFEQASSNAPSWDRDVYGQNDETRKAARGARAFLDSLGYSVRYLAGDDSLASPKLHLKANFLASAVAWDKLNGLPEWGDVVRAYLEYLAKQRPTVEELGDNTIPEAWRDPDRMTEAGQALMRAYVESMTPEEREQVVLYMSVGSVNMDYRSMVMDGEVMILLSHWESLGGVMDFVLLAGLCEWPQTLEELDALLPPPGGFTRSMAGLMRLAL
jgi:hypothetical protein